MRYDWMKVCGLFFAAFLLGRVHLFQEALPFALPFVAVICRQSKPAELWMAVAAITGAVTADISLAGKLTMELIFYVLINGLFRTATTTDDRQTPFYVFLSILPVQCFRLFFEAQITGKVILSDAVELILAVLFCILVIHARELLLPALIKSAPKAEESVSFLMVVSAAISGMHDWGIAGISLSDVSRLLLVLVIATAGGAANGALAGLICGLIGSLPEPDQFQDFGMLAAGGFFAGMAYKRDDQSRLTGFWLGLVSAGVYYFQHTWFAVLIEGVVVTVLYLLIPERIRQSAEAILPQIRTIHAGNQEYARRIREIATARIRQFAAMFRHLGQQFRQLSPDPQELPKNRVEQTLQIIVQRHCAGCEKRTVCWEQQFSTTVHLLGQRIADTAELTGIGQRMSDEMERHCISAAVVMNTIEWSHQNWREQSFWKLQVQESREFVSRQLYGVSQVMEHLADEISAEKESLDRREDQLLKAIQELGSSVKRAELLSLEPGQVRIELTYKSTEADDFCRVVLAPMFSAILQENIIMINDFPVMSGRNRHAVFASAKQLVIETGMAGTAKNGGVMSGDSFSTIELGEGKMVIAISDGMGNGTRAREESTAALTILQQMMQSGIDEQLAVQMVNSLLILRSSDEMYATVDLACIDLNKGTVTFLKNGSIPSYILRGKEIITVNSESLPVGIVEDIDVHPMRFQLIPGDRLLLMSDGVYDANDWLTDYDRWLKQVIAGIGSEDPQRMAEQLMETVVNRRNGKMNDDLTILVAKVGNLQKEWATVRWTSGSSSRKKRWQRQQSHFKPTRSL